MSDAKTIKQNLLASIPVFLVSIPLCLGIALASNVPLFAGILTGIIGGIVVGFLSESRVSVSGPAAGMIAVVLTAVSQLGSYQLFLLALLLAGGIQLLGGLFRTGFIANYVPATVIKGLLAAIGILIIINQIPLAFGYFKDSSSVLEALHLTEQSLDVGAFDIVLSHISYGSAIISCLSLIVLFSWDKIPHKRLKMLPSSCVVVILGIAINGIYQLLDNGFALKAYHLVNIPIIHSFSDLTTQFQHPDLSGLLNVKVYMYAVMIAIVASLETLLNLEGIEKIDKSHRYCSRDKELIAQGAGNLISGLLGGLPITSVIVRSSVNIYAGATSKLSSIFNGFLLILSLTLMASLLNYIPIASLAAILIHTGFKLATPKLFKDIYAQGARYFIPFLITVIAIIASNLLLGIIIGLVCSLFFILKDNSQSCFSIVSEKHPSGDVLRLMLPQQLTFLNRAAMISGLNAIPAHTKVIIDATSTDFIDEDIVEIIKEDKDILAKEKNILFNFEGFKEHYDIKHKNSFIQATTYDVQSSLAPQDVLMLLQEGNARFVNNTPIRKNYKQQMAATEDSQHPMAVVLGCIDSRVPVELVFNLSLGDVFVARIAGNIANEDILGSIEFACDVAGAKLIVVLGHKGCGAVKAACENFQLGHLTQLIDKIKPAVMLEQERHLQHEDQQTFITQVAQNNVELTKHWIYEHSAILKNLISTGKVGLIGAFYDISTGQVTFDSELHIKERA